MEYLLFKYLWLIAILPKTIQFFALGVLAFLVSIKTQGRLSAHKDLFSNTILVTNIIFTFAIMTSLLSGPHETSRLLAAINTCGITYIAFFFCKMYSLLTVDLYKISRYMFFNMLILLGIYLFYKCVGMSGNFTFMHGSLCGPDWINGKYETRFRGYLEYTNLVVYMYLYCFPVSLIYVRRKLKKVGCLVYELALTLPIISTNSRTGIVCTFFLTAAVIILFNSKMIFKIYARHKKTVLIFASIFVVVVITFFFGKLQSVISTIMSARQGSTDTRMQIYIASLTKMWKESPIWGCGIKDYFGGFPYGSHSTYIGMFYKTGILGGSIYLFGMAVNLLQFFIRKEINPFSLAVRLGYACIFALSIFEDLDGANWNIVIFATLFCILFTRKNNIDTIGNQP